MEKILKDCIVQKHIFVIRAIKTNRHIGITNQDSKRSWFRQSKSFRKCCRIVWSDKVRLGKNNCIYERYIIEMIQNKCRYTFISSRRSLSFAISLHVCVEVCKFAYSCAFDKIIHVNIELFNALFSSKKETLRRSR